MTNLIEDDAGHLHCSECYVGSHDVQRGHLTVAVPSGCGDEDCACHGIAHQDDWCMACGSPVPGSERHVPYIHCEPQDQYPYR